MNQFIDSIVMNVLDSRHMAHAVHETRLERKR